MIQVKLISIRPRVLVVEAEWIPRRPLKQVGLTIPVRVLERANRVIKCNEG